MFARLPGEIELQHLGERHAQEVFGRVDADRAYLRRWLAWVNSTESIEDTRLFLRGAAENLAEDRAITLGIWVGGKFAGVAGTHRIDWLNRRVEIGYWLGEAFQGRGIMTTACRSLVEHLFRDRRLHRIECLCATGNARSCAIPKRLGFRREAELREVLLLDGEYHDVFVWSLLAPEWK